MTRSGFIAPVVILPNPSWDVLYLSATCNYETMYQPSPQRSDFMDDCGPFLCLEDPITEHAVRFLDHGDAAGKADSDKTIPVELDPHAVCAIRTRLGSHNDATRSN